MQPLGELLDEGSEGGALSGGERLPVHVHAVNCVYAAPVRDGRDMATAGLRRRQNGGRDRRIESVSGRAVVGERDDHTAVLLARLGDEACLGIGRGDAAVGPRLQPVHAHFVDGAGVDGARERSAVAEGPGADEVRAVRALVLKDAGERKGGGHRRETDDEDDDQRRCAATPRPADAADAAFCCSSARRHAFIMTPERPPEKPGPWAPPSVAGRLRGGRGLLA